MALFSSINCNNPGFRGASQRRTNKQDLQANLKCFKIRNILSLLILLTMVLQVNRSSNFTTIFPFHKVSFQGSIWSE